MYTKWWLSELAIFRKGRQSIVKMNFRWNHSRQQHYWEMPFYAYIFYTNYTTIFISHIIIQSILGILKTI